MVFRAALALAVTMLLGSCLGPPPSHALVVRNLESKCALIAFSGCGAFYPPPASADEEDAGIE